MPLDADGRRYADNLFQNSAEDIEKDALRQTAEIHAAFSKRSIWLPCPHYAGALGRVFLDHFRRLAQARMVSLLSAYEKAGLPFDDACLQEIETEVVQFCNTLQQEAALRIEQEAQRVFGDRSAADEERQAVTSEVRDEIRKITSRVARDLRVKRDEIILGERRARRAYAAGLGKAWDAFVCHASEDKEEFVRPLAQALQDSGLTVWYDESTLKVGDSLRMAIDGGLAHSRFGIVVLSNNFFAKRWPQQELDGLVSKEVEGVKVILPVWHNISFEDVCRNSPMLAGRLAARSSDGLPEVIRQLREAMGL